MTTDETDVDIEKVINGWEVPDEWVPILQNLLSRKSIEQNIAILKGSDDTTCTYTHWLAALGRVKVVGEGTVPDNIGLSERVILIDGFGGTTSEEITAAANSYLRRTLVEGFADVVYPNWGDTPMDFIQLIIAMFDARGQIQDRLERQNKWPLRGAFTARIKSMCKSLGRLNCNVLISGPSGIGKEAVARLIHEHSQVEGRFVPISIPAIPSELFASVLFGYDKGDYTGALQKQLGGFEKAHGGTLFLDEIADIDPKQQAALLRALSERRASSIGGTREYQISCRVIAATNRLDRLHSGFRSDLRIRLAEQEITASTDPNGWQPLRSLSLVREEIPLLFAMQYVRCFHEQIGYSQRANIITLRTEDGNCLGDEVFDKLANHDWPMNFRELGYVALHSLVRFLMEKEILHNETRSKLSQLDIVVKTESRYDTEQNRKDDLNAVVKSLLSRIPTGVKGWNYLSDMIRHAAILFLKANGSTEKDVVSKLGIDRSSVYRFTENYKAKYSNGYQ